MNRAHDFQQFEQRFWEKVEKTPTCWNWTAYNDRAGYGKVGFADIGTIHATHAAWFFRYGMLPTKGTAMVHACDNAACVNPDHLAPATQKANMEDMAAKGRSPWGDSHWSRRNPEKVTRGEKNSTKLMACDVLEIRRLADQGYRCRILAEKFSVSKAQIVRIVKRQRWGHV